MIYELNPSQFNMIAHLLEGERVTPEIKDIVNRRQIGWVFVDNVMNPETAMIWSKEKGMFFIGSTRSDNFNDSLFDYMKYILFPRIKRMNFGEMACYGANDAWDTQLKQLVEKVDVNHTADIFYKTPADMNQKSVSKDGRNTFPVYGFSLK